MKNLREVIYGWSPVKGYESVVGEEVERDGLGDSVRDDGGRDSPHM